MKEGDRKRAIVAEVVAHAWRDAAYLDRLQKSPKATLMQAGLAIPPSMDVIYVENTPTVINAILPRKEDMPQYHAQLDNAVKLLDRVPANVEVRIHRDSDTRSYFVMPVAPRAMGELSEEDLEQVAGGKGGSTGGAVMGVLISQPELSVYVASAAQVATIVEAAQIVAGVTVAVGAVDVVAAVAAVIVPILIT
jgi:hypothetical protein